MWPYYPYWLSVNLPTHTLTLHTLTLHALTLHTLTLHAHTTFNMCTKIQKIHIKYYKIIFRKLEL